MCLLKLNQYDKVSHDRLFASTYICIKKSMHRCPTIEANSLDDLMRQLKERQGDCTLERITIVIMDEVLTMKT